MHYGLVFLLIAVAMVAFVPGAAVLALSKGILLFMLLAGLVSLMVEIWVKA